MHQIQRPKIHRVADLWKAYAENILAADPNTYSRRAVHYSKIPHYYIYRKLERGVEDVMDYAMFKNILETYFSYAKDVIIEGQAFPLGFGLGNIEARRIERNFKNKAIDWKSTMAQEKGPDGKIKQYIYHLDEDYCRIAWGKVSGPSACPGSKKYAFEPTPDDGTGKGFVPEFFTALNKDVTLKYKYKYYPYT